MNFFTGIGLVWLLFIAHAQAKTENIVVRFATSAPGTSPYLYFNEIRNSYQGVVVDFFDSFESDRDFTVIYIESSRARNEQIFLSAKADLFLSGVPWLEKPEQFIFSDTLMPHNSYMYSKEPFAEPFIPSRHKNASICTRHGFVYPVLSPLFKDERLLRVDSSTQTNMTHMLAKDRCEFAIMSDDNARAIMSDTTFCDVEFYQSPNNISAVDLVIVMRPQLTQIKLQIDKQLAIFIESGERDKAIKRHIGEKVFPKRRCE